MRSVLGGALLAARRLRTRRIGGAIGAALLVVVAAALEERRAAQGGALDRTLVGAVFGVVVPLLAFAAVGRITAGTNLVAALDPLARHGLDRRGLAVGALATVAVALAASSACLAWTALVIARPGPAGWLGEIVQTGWIGAVAGAAYAVLLLAGATLGATGWGRGVALVLDWVLGAGTTFAAAPWPRGHVRSLLGGDRVAELGAVPTQLVLGTVTLLLLGLALRRTPP